MTECQNCSKEFKSRSKPTQKYCSQECAQYARRWVERPTKEQLDEMMKTMSFAAIGREYGVSNKAVIKWARTYGLWS